MQLSPDVGFEKYMYLGQLLEGQQALAATQKGVELLQQVTGSRGLAVWRGDDAVSQMD